MESVRVIYLMDPEDQDPQSVFAYFLDELADFQGNHTSYQHIGQHGACSPSYAVGCREALPGEYEELHRELAAIYLDDSQSAPLEIQTMNGQGEWPGDDIFIPILDEGGY